MGDTLRTSSEGSALKEEKIVMTTTSQPISTALNAVAIATTKKQSPPILVSSLEKLGVGDSKEILISDLL